jgi:branched-chain amino acid transport system ATP-binding protein
MLSVDKIEAGYSGIKAVREVSVTISEGELVALVGPNGAGKSTLLNCLSGILPPSRGTIRFCGSDIAGSRAASIARMGLLHVPEGRQILSDLTVEENLLVGMLARGTRKATHELTDVIKMFPILGERKRQIAGSLSGGQQQMLAIGRALMGSPRMLLLDEPSLGLSPLIAGQVLDAVVELNRKGLTILLVEQNARRALEITERAYVIEQGEIVAAGRSADLAGDPTIIDHYLGGGASTHAATASARRVPSL